MTLDKPYFMNNAEWYYFDEEEFCYKLTDQATDKAKESYEEFYNNLNKKFKEEKENEKN